MFEFEELSSGFHDLFMNKYSDGPIMDLYISDSMQDMLDIDIKSEVATVVGGANEFSSLMNYDLPSLEISGDSNSDDNISWLGGPKWSAVQNDIYADVGACVNPNSVMPTISISSNTSHTNGSLLKSPKNQLELNTNVNLGADTSQLPSPREQKSHLTFSPSTIKVPMVQDKRLSSLARTNNGVDQVKKDLQDDFKDAKFVNKPMKRPITNGNMSPSLARGANTIKLAGGIGGLTFANNMQFQKLKQQVVNKQNSIMNGTTIPIKRERSSSPLPQFSHISNGIESHTAIATTPKHNMGSMINNRNLVQRQPKPPMLSMGSGSTKTKQDPIPNEFPKPAYSYSCLIALALKNSRSGSLPVSEIYSFMCEHFPYFKTAPNGWKNSVRHNLSLNKCFEKIEKPATNGGQRKGCLWAMNPSKIAKMDDEVQKWSRKDPMAIRKAMVHPEHLESLERGEMKHGSTGESDGENEDNEEDEPEDVASDLDNDVDESYINTPPESCEDEPDVDFDVEVGEFYDDLSMDTKEGILESIGQKAFLNDMTLTNLYSDDPMISSAKRARLDVNYSITTTTSNGGSQFSTTPNVINQNRRKAPLMNRLV